MPCQGQDVSTEWAYTLSLRGRRHDQCRGPLIRLTLPAGQLAVLEHALLSTVAFERLWDGYESEYPDVTFALCAAHWMDLSYLTGIHGFCYARPSWTQAATDLLIQLCREASWDVKEIANMVTWQRVLLT